MKKTEYTCDRCGGGISIYGTGWLLDNSMVIVEESMPGVADCPKIKRHLHHHCWVEIVDWMKSGSVHHETSE